MSTSSPSPAEQVEFLGNVERLLAEGQFSATYKYALLVALADLAVERGSDDCSELELPVKLIGERFVEMYWRQALPFSPGVSDGDGMTLLQNKGRQAAMISGLARMQRRHPTLASARRSKDWRPVVRDAARLVTTMPLWRLQVIGRQSHEFLYSRSPRRGYIHLKPGVAANLRRFHGLVVRLAQSEWLRFVQETNLSLLGPAVDLGDFLFGANRRGLRRLRDGLKDLQSGRCFYCARAIADGGDVDHFIAWSRYPRDLAHNFVLAHATCNAHKRDRLAYEAHLERWVTRSHTDAAALAQLGDEAGFIADWPTSQRVARWSYGRAASLDARVWVARDELEPLSGRWKQLLV
jgi:hypothetical protein